MAVIQVPPTTALVLVDVQKDFLPPSGALAVPLGDKILPCIATLLDDYKWNLVIASGDWHPPGHISFASSHPGKKVSESIKIDAPYQEEKVTQVLWPDHCVQFTDGAYFEADLEARLKTIQDHGTKLEVVEKGKNPVVDAYSVFADNVYSGFTEMVKVLHQNKIQRIVLVGLAADYCLRFTAIDARKFGFDTILITDGTRAVNPKDVDEIFADLDSRGVNILSLEEFKKTPL